jgi:outer membrane protein OmpA-like peptidoglycan-associated protein
MKRSILVSLILSFVILASTYAFAIQDDEKLEHSVIKPMPGAKLVDRTSYHSNHHTLQLRVKEGRKRITKEVTGEYWHLKYIMKDGSGNQIKRISKGEVIGNYLAAALEKEGKVHSKGSNYLIVDVPRDGGGTTWVSLRAATASYLVEIIDEKSLNPVLSFGAEELKKALDVDGRIAVYGINFAVNSDRLELGAEKIISEVVKLLTLYSDLKIEIQGHTDNTGSAAHNLALSNRRANTVKDFILLFGVNSSQMTSKGFGMTEPVESNDTEEGKAKNRRVELVKIK